jgi:hypothetical protein
MHNLLTRGPSQGRGNSLSDEAGPQGVKAFPIANLIVSRFRTVGNFLWPMRYWIGTVRPQ